MGCLTAAAGALIAYGHYVAGNWALAGAAALATLITLWSFGVMHNFATEAASKRSDYKGGFSDFDDDDLREVPNWLTTVNMVSAMAVLALGLAWAWMRWLA